MLQPRLTQPCPHDRRPATSICLYCLQEARAEARRKRRRVMARAGLATMGHYAMARAFRAAPLAVTQPVSFLQLIWAALLRALAFCEPVEVWVIAGGALIILAISANTWAEARRERQAPALVEEP